MPFYLRCIICAVPIALTPIITYLVYKSAKDAQEKCILRFPRFYRIVPFLQICFTVICSVYILLFQFEEWPYILILLGFFGMPSLIMFITWSLWRVNINEDGFVYRNFWGVSKEYKYVDLKYQMHPKGLKWYFYRDDKKVFCMAYYIENGDFLEKMYRKNINKLKNANNN